MGPADFIVPFWAKLGYNQVTAFIEQEKPITILYDESVSPTNGCAGRGGLKRFPNAFSSLGLQATELAITLR